MGQVTGELVGQYNEQLRKMKEEEKAGGEERKGELRVIWEPAENMNVHADKMRIIQVISNLLDNAIKFTSEGDVYVSMKKEAEGDQTSIVVSVKDEGVGMDAEMLTLLFTKFVSKSEIGTGLGLFICKGIVEAHGGKIWAENNPDDRGATFTFTIPVKQYTLNEFGW